jgi:hypothetical protein
VFSSSSRQVDRVNPDGTLNVYCWMCGEFITATTLRMNRALCELCRRTEAGETIPADVLRDYKLSKGKHVNVSMLLLPEETSATRKKFSFRSMMGEVLEALGVKQPEKVPEASKVIARQKKRGRLFENVDIGTVDQGLREKKDV